MGMYDEVAFDAELPDFPLICRRFQTKSLDRCLDRYLVTKAGRLLLVGNVIADEMPAAARLEERFDIECHGEIRLVAKEGKHEEYVARFTNGTFESIRPLDRSQSAPIEPVTFKVPELKGDTGDATNDLPHDVRDVD